MGAKDGGGEGRPLPARVPPFDGAEWRERFREVADALRAYAHPSNWRNGKPLRPLAADTALWPVAILEELGAGHIPPQVRAVALPHRAGDTPGRIAAQATAVAFLALAGRSDRARRKAIAAAAFAVDPNTVGRWLRDRAVRLAATRQLRQMRATWGAGWPRTILPTLLQQDGKWFQYQRQKAPPYRR